MAQVRKSVLIAVAALACSGLLIGARNAPSAAPARLHFYPDDPITREPPPLPVDRASVQSIDAFYDFMVNSLGSPRDQAPHDHPRPAQNVNTLGEVPDGDWYTNRNYFHPMSIEQLRRGPDEGNAPVLPLQVTGAKTQGVTPGFNIKDAKGRRYLIKFDPPSNPEMATACDVIGSKFFYAFGYNVPQNYLINFRRDQLTVAPSARLTDLDGVKRAMDEHDLDVVLRKVPHRADGSFRGMASFIIPGKVIGSFKYVLTRPDDPNDIYLHENHRELRGLYVFAAWLQHTDVKATNSLDSIQTIDGIPRVRHYLIDFGAILGSDSDAPKDPKLGHAYFLNWGGGLTQMLSLGLAVPAWERTDFDTLPAVGNFVAEPFDPRHWTSNYPNPAFLNRLPDDDFWAARQVVSFRPEQIRAMVETGGYTNPEAASYITRALLERQHKIGVALLTEVLPLDRFAVRDGGLTFQDVAAEYGYGPQKTYRVSWFAFDNNTGATTPIVNASTLTVPAQSQSEYVMALIQDSSQPRKTVKVYIRQNRIVGVQRTW